MAINTSNIFFLGINFGSCEGEKTFIPFRKLPCRDLSSSTNATGLSSLLYLSAEESCLPAAPAPKITIFEETNYSRSKELAASLLNETNTRQMSQKEKKRVKDKNSPWTKELRK